MFESEFVWFTCSFRGSAIDDHHIGDLFQFYVQSESFSFDVVEVTVSYEVSVALIVLIAQKLDDEIWIRF